MHKQLRTLDESLSEIERRISRDRPTRRQLREATQELRLARSSLMKSAQALLLAGDDATSLLERVARIDHLIEAVA